MKIKVGVFFGGKSVEHEVSVISALQACNAMNKDKYEVIPVYITKANELYVGEKIGQIESYRNIPALLKESRRVIPVSEGNKLQLVYYPAKKFGDNVYANIEVAFPIVHGTNVEDGTIEGFFGMYNIPYVGCDVVSSAVGMDKYVMKTVFKDCGIPVLDCMLINRSDYSETAAKDEFITCAEKKIGYPVIVKPVNLGSSVGIKVAADRETFEEALDNAFMFANKVLVERAITNLKEINCSVLGDSENAQASECEQPLSAGEILSYKDKYVNDGSKSSGMASLKRLIPADITREKREEIREMAIKAFKALGCNGVVRIDFMIDMDTRKVYLNEINTIPGSLAFYLWEPLGKKYSELLDDMIGLAFKRERENQWVNYSFDTNILENMSFGGKSGAKGGKL